jgi:DNA-binding MarR family transcriptional regulator
VLGFMSLLWALNHELESLSKRMAVAFGVTGPQRLAVRIVGRSPGISAGELADVLRVHPSTLTGIVHRLVDSGLLERRRDPADARRTLLVLTARGRAIDTMRNGTVESAISRALRQVPPSQLGAAMDVLEQLALALEKEARGGRARVAPR